MHTHIHTYLHIYMHIYFVLIWSLTNSLSPAPAGHHMYSLHRPILFSPLPFGLCLHLCPFTLYPSDFLSYLLLLLSSLIWGLGGKFHARFLQSINLPFLLYLIPSFSLILLCLNNSFISFYLVSFLTEHLTMYLDFLMSNWRSFCLCLLNSRTTSAHHYPWLCLETSCSCLTLINLRILL